MTDLFPCRARIGSSAYGLDADYADHKNTNVAYPDLTVSEKPEPLILWHGDGERYRVISDHVQFGFQPGDKP